MFRPHRVSVWPMIVLGLFLALPARADFKISHSKGFARVVEIVEKTENADGTLTVKARKSHGDTELVEYLDVKSIEEVEAGAGLAPMKDLVPTPTVSIRTEAVLPGSGAPAVAPQSGPAPNPAGPAASPGSTAVEREIMEEYPVLKTFMDHLTWVFTGGIVLVIVLFMFFRTRS